jgi:SAM-dependent methyltransferase
VTETVDGAGTDEYAQPDIEAVRRFWDENPLWTGEAGAEAGTLEFFEEHRQVYYEDCFAGALDERIFSLPSPDAQVLDLGCGIGFWLVEFWKRGFHHLTAADLSPVSLDIAAQRCSLYGVTARFAAENAEALSFPDASFDHVNCQGVIHHTPDTVKAVAEIARVLKPGGSASISVYYRNFALRHWSLLRPFAQIAAAAGSKLRGRGREGIYRVAEVDEIVRLYDGAANPIGKAYDEDSFQALLEPHFAVEELYFHFFPARSIPVRIPHVLHGYLDRNLPFMIYANLRKH